MPFYIIKVGDRFDIREQSHPPLDEVPTIQVITECKTLQEAQEKLGQHVERRLG
jgi:hypothetical protein